MTRLTTFFQLPLSLVILAWIPTNLGKLAALVTLWFCTFRHLTKCECWGFGIACIFFSIMNVASLQQGIFAFSFPDVAGMPYYEFFMWGFYLLHTKRLLGGTPPPRKLTTASLLALAYSLAFATISNPNVLLSVTATLLIIGLLLFHEPLDLAYTAYMIALGAAIEYTGVLSGQWYYPDSPLSGVPLWFVTLWGGVGLFLRRLVIPILHRCEYPSVKTP